MIEVVKGGIAASKSLLDLVLRIGDLTQTVLASYALMLLIQLHLPA
jgi:hypothetical protein